MITSKTCLTIDNVLDFIYTATDDECRLITGAAADNIFIPNWFDRHDLQLTPQAMRQFINDASHSSFCDTISEKTFAYVAAWKRERERR